MRNEQALNPLINAILEYLQAVRNALVIVTIENE